MLATNDVKIGLVVKKETVCGSVALLKVVTGDIAEEMLVVDICAVIVVTVVMVDVAMVSVAMVEVAMLVLVATTFIALLVEVIVCGTVAVSGQPQEDAQAERTAAFPLQ